VHFAELHFSDLDLTRSEGASAKIDRPALTAYYEARTNGRDAAIQIAENQNWRMVVRLIRAAARQPPCVSVRPAGRAFLEVKVLYTPGKGKC
jgi:hypothetical protein